MTRIIFPLAAVLVLAGCNATGGIDAVGNRDFSLTCKGKFTLSITGSVAAFSGANGAITGDCGDGAEFSKTSGASLTPSTTSPVTTTPLPPRP